MIGVLHLSDMHISDEKDSLYTKRDALLNSFKYFPENISDCLLLISGDIVYAGTAGQYEKAKGIINDCISAIRASGIVPHVCMVPGNHDCDFTHPNVVRTTLLETVNAKPDKFDPSFISICCSPQKAFSDFVGDYHATATDDDSAIYSRLTLTLQGKSVSIHLFNTAWCSRKKEVPGTLLIPEYILAKARKPTDSALNLSLLHHSLNWLNPDNARLARTVLDEISDFIFFGHEHIPALRVQKDLMGSFETIISEGDVLGDSENDDNSGYKLFIIDIDKHTYMLEKKEWSGDLYKSYCISSPKWLPLNTKVKRPMAYLEVSLSFAELMDDPGAAYKHPRIAELSLKDIYVPPQLRELDDTSLKNPRFADKRMSSSKIVLERDTPLHCLIGGSSQSGKTSLLYYYFRAAYSNHLVPIYVDLSGIKLSGLKDFDRLLEDAVLNEYNAITLDYFRQLDQQNKILLLDNYHSLRLNAAARRDIMHAICCAYSHVIVASDTFLTMDEIADYRTKRADFSSFHLQLFQLLPFGHVLRGDLITKWIELGQEDTISHQELAREHDELKLTLDSVIGENLVPPYPIFLLIILQQCDSDIPYDIQSSAYGYYYEYLIIQALRGISRKNAEIDSHYTYITELSYYLFENHRRLLSERELSAFHVRHCDKYRISTDFSTTLKNLLSAKILMDEHGAFRFRYPYVYYFFVAKYLANNMSQDSVRDRVGQMCERIYYDEFANIVVFLIHLSKDPFIIQQIIEMARGIFPGEVPYQFESPIPQLAQLLASTPSLVMERRDVNEERRKQFIAKDRQCPPNAEAAEKLPEKEYSFDSQVKDSGSPEHHLMSLKSIEILGQILRNYYGSLTAEPKYNLAMETYMIALRGLRRFYDKLSMSADSLRAYLLGALKSLNITDEREREEIASNLLFFLCIAIPDVYIQQVTKAVANRNLSGTFSDLLADNYTPGVRLIDLSIKMSCERAFPLEETVKLAQDLENDYIASFILKKMVLDHFYLFPRSYKEKQTICDRLKIPIEERRRVIASS